MNGWRVAGSAIAVAAAMNGFISPTQANAQDAMTLPSSITAVRHGSLAADGTVEPDEVINCEYDYVDDPHESSFKPGTVNVHAKVTCDHAVASLSMTVDLYLNGNSVGVTPQPRVRSGRVVKWNSASSSCIDGNYYGASGTDITFPAGYEPPTGEIGLQGNTVPITCK